MSTRDDDLTTREDPDRVFYATGVFLDAEDLAAEQRYHRGRLARALGYLHGPGTVAGLRVDWDGASEELRVQPGVAVDRLGRLVEVPRRACVHLLDWLEQQRQEALAGPSDVTHPIVLAVSPDGTALQVDVFLRFAVCERGRTPAFATGPYDAIDASQPNRLRDSYELALELRGFDAPTPSNPWPSRGAGQPLDAFLGDLQDYVLDQAWLHGADWPGGELPYDAGTSGAGDPTSVFLARVTVPVALDGDGLPAWTRTAGALDPAVPDNHLRSFSLGGPALARWIEAAATP
ncbi:MAG: hypothetical protein R3F59_05105 [Myxococcota bacterium]